MTLIDNGATYQVLTYDIRNRLTKIETFNKAEAPDPDELVETIEYTYDLLNRRTSKTVDDLTATNDDHLESYAYDIPGQHADGDNLVYRFEDGDLTNRYLFGDGIDEILADEQVTATNPDGTYQAGNVLWALNRSPRLCAGFSRLLKTPITTRSKTPTVIKNHIKYNAFGEY